MRPIVLILCSLTWSAVGCLDPNTGATTGAIGDASADTSPDASTSADVEPEAITVIEPWCFGVTCDDNNPCTDDYCDESLQGQCVYTPKADGTPCKEAGCCLAGTCSITDFAAPAEPPECSEDLDCDDGDPCTISTCRCDGADACGNSTGWCWCSHEPSPAPECQAPEQACNGNGALTPAEAMQLEPGTVTKIGGATGPVHFALCEDGCGTCPAELGLKGDVSSMSIAPSNWDTLGIWGCSVDGCPAVTSCSPLVADVSYWAWGYVRTHDPYFVGGAPERRLELTGWCINTLAPSFAGTYTGTIQPVVGDSIPFTLTVTLGPDGAWTVGLSDMEGQEPQTASNVAVTDGRLEFEAFVMDGYTGWSKFRLDSDRSTLGGDYWETAKPFNAAAEAPGRPPSGGTVLVSRTL